MKIKEAFSELLWLEFGCVMEKTVLLIILDWSIDQGRVAVVILF